MKRFTIFFSLLCLMCICGATPVFAQNESKTAPLSETARPVKIMKLRADSGTTTHTFHGTSRYVRDVDLAFRVNGPLVIYPEHIGKLYKKGQLVAAIDPRDFRIKVEAVKAKLLVAQAELNEAKLNFERIRQLHEEKQIAKADFDHALAALEMAKGQVSAINTELNGAQNALRDTRLVAPFDGWLAAKLTENYEHVAAGRPVVKLLDNNALEIQVGIPEEIAIRGNEFQDFSCTFVALPGKTFAAKLVELGRHPISSKQVYPLTVTIDNPSKELRSGMTAALTVTFANSDAKGHTGFTVPQEALLKANDGQSSLFVYDASSGTVSKRAVRVGGLSGKGMRVLSGTAPGELIVTAGARYLVDGQKVVPTNDISKL